MKLFAAAKILFITQALSYPANLIAQSTALPPGGFDVVLRGGEKVQEIMGQEYPTYRNDCTFHVQGDGNLSIKSGFLNGGFDSNQNSFCGCENPHEAIYHLQQNGNLVAKCGEVIDYSTHTSDGPDVTGADYFLAIDNNCVLHIYEGTVTSDSITVENEVWSSVKKQLRRGERLGKGEQVFFEKDGFVLIMKSDDGNLVLYKGYSDDIPLWGANRHHSWVKPDTDPCFDDTTNYDTDHDFFATVHDNGMLTLKVVGSAEPYLRYDLHSGGAEDFTVGYMLDPSSSSDTDYILVAMCDGSPCVDPVIRNLRAAT